MTGHDGAMSELSTRIRSDLTEAMKARDEVTVSTLRMVISAISTASVAGDSAVELSDEQIIDVLRSEGKRRTEAAEVFQEAGRADRAKIIKNKKVFLTFSFALKSAFFNSTHLLKIAPSQKEKSSA